MGRCCHQISQGHAAQIALAAAAQADGTGFGLLGTDHPEHWDLHLLAIADQLLGQLKAAGVRASIDHSGDRLGKLIRNGEQMKIPVLGVIGAKEAESQEISLRSRREGDLGSVALAALVAAATRANQDRSAGLPLG